MTSDDRQTSRISLKIESKSCMPLCSCLPLRHASHSPGHDRRTARDRHLRPSTRNALASRPVLTLLQRPVASGCAHRLVWLLSLISVAPLTPPTPPPSSLPPSAPSSFTMPRTAPLLLALCLWPARARRPQPAPRRSPRPCPPSLAWARCPPPPHERRPGHHPPPKTRRTGRDSLSSYCPLASTRLCAPAPAAPP